MVFAIGTAFRDRFRCGARHFPAPDNCTRRLARHCVWRAAADGLPFVALNITNESGNLSGAVLFYLHRSDEGKPVTSTPGIPEPIFNPQFDGETLTFQVSHRRAHPPRTLADPPVSFRLKLTGINTGGMSTGDLTNESEGPSGLQLVRTDH
jgi:hypothetical protein